MTLTGSPIPQSKDSMSRRETLEEARVKILKHTEEEITIIKVWSEGFGKKMEMIYFPSSPGSKRKSYVREKLWMTAGASGSLAARKGPGLHRP